MKKLIALVALLAVSCCSTAVYAGAYGSAILKVSDAKLQKLSGAVWVDATASDFANVSATFSVSTDATLTGFGSDSHSTITSFDATQAFVGAGGAPAENTISSNGMASSYARADTAGSGSLIGPTPLPGFVSVDTLGEINALAGELGSGEAGIASGGAFKFVALTTGTFRFSMHAELDLIAMSDATGLASAGAGFGANINSVGVGGGVLTNLSPASLNKLISGNNSYSFSGDLTSSSFSLEKDKNYSFNINQGTEASIAPIPEPGSIAVFGLLSLGTVIARRRRS